MPYLPEIRQYRNFAATNFQPVVQDSDSEVRTYSVEGHFTEFESEYPLVPGFYETIDRHALDHTDMSDVLFQFNHGGMVLSRLRNGSLSVGIDERGGWAKADLGGCQQGRDLYEAISNGLIDRMSFGFTIAEGGVTYDEDDEGNIHSRITNIDKLYDVSAVDLPASEYTDISARSYANSIIEARKKLAEPEVAGCDEAVEQSSDGMCELTKPAFTDEELDAIADALERRAMERRSGDPDGEKEERELPDFLKDDDDDEEKRESDEDVEERDCDDDELERIASQQAEEQRAAEEAVERAHRRRMRRARAMALTSS